MKTKITQNIKAIILGLIITVGMGYVAAADFAGPGCAPPACNTEAPINVGGGGAVGTPAYYAQTKTGPLTLLHLFTSDFSFIPSGVTITDGQVLTADGNTGKVKWGSNNTKIKSGTFCNEGFVRLTGDNPVIFSSPFESIPNIVITGTKDANDPSSSHTGRSEYQGIKSKTINGFVAAFGGGGDASCFDWIAIEP